MKFKFIVLSFLLITSFAAFSKEKQPRKAEKENTGVFDKGLIKVSVMYPYAEGKTFNMEYYETKHMPMVAALLGSNLVKYTIEKGLANGILLSDPTEIAFVRTFPITPMLRLLFW